MHSVRAGATLSHLSIPSCVTGGDRTLVRLTSQWSAYCTRGEARHECRGISTARIPGYSPGRGYSHRIAESHQHEYPVPLYGPSCARVSLFPIDYGVPGDFLQESAIPAGISP